MGEITVTTRPFIFLTILVTILATINESSASPSLRIIHDDDLMDQIRADSYVIALFSTNSECELCQSYENSLVGLKEELSKDFDVVQPVKLINSQMTRLYSPTKEPIIVFFRHGIPLLYNGPPNEDLILHTFLNNKEPAVRELTDETFEHLTQVATGATTGDWFVMFDSPECVDCHRLQARWEAVGAQLKSRLNVARINKGTVGVATAKRFEVTQVPSFLLFRQGKLYRYQIQKYDIESFVAFAQDWYKNVKPERVPSPLTPFDELVESFVNILKENPYLLQIGLGTALVGFLLSLLARRLRVGVQISPQEPEKTDDEKTVSKQSKHSEKKAK